MKRKTRKSADPRFAAFCRKVGLPVGRTRSLPMGRCAERLVDRFREGHAMTSGHYLPIAAGVRFSRYRTLANSRRRG
jgi:hypothetical protein